MCIQQMAANLRESASTSADVRVLNGAALVGVGRMLAGERPGGDLWTSLIRAKPVGQASMSPVPFHKMQAPPRFVPNESKSVGPHNYHQFVKSSQSQHQ